MDTCVFYLTQIRKIASAVWWIFWNFQVVPVEEFNSIQIIQFLTTISFVQENMDDLALVSVSLKAFDLLERLHFFLFLRQISSPDDSSLDS